MSLQGIHPEGLSPKVRKYMCTILFVAVLFAIRKHWKQVRGPYREDDLTSVHPFIVQYNVTVKNNEDDFYSLTESLTESDVQVLLSGKKSKYRGYL